MHNIKQYCIVTLCTFLIQTSFSQSFDLNEYKKDENQRLFNDTKIKNGIKLTNIANDEVQIIFHSKFNDTIITLKNSNFYRKDFIVSDTTSFLPSNTSFRIKLNGRKSRLITFVNPYNKSYVSLKLLAKYRLVIIYRRNCCKWVFGFTNFIPEYN